MMQPPDGQRDRDHQGEREKGPSTRPLDSASFWVATRCDERRQQQRGNAATTARLARSDVEETVDEYGVGQAGGLQQQADVVDDLFGTGNEVRIDGSGEDREVTQNERDRDDDRSSTLQTMGL